ncbi:MAG: AAA family ATPase [Methylococcaceae bacterium]|nr:AAA family ATPase [Methylococcaceae bacterium]
MITTIFATKSSTKTSIAVSAAVYLKNKGVDVLLCDLDSQKSAVIWMEYRDADQSLTSIPTVEKSGTTVYSSLKELSSKYEHLICDCGGKNDASGRYALLVSDLVIVPVFPSNISLMTLNQSLRSLEEAKVQNEGLKAVIVLTGVNSNPRIKDTDEAREAISELIADFDYVTLAGGFITARKIWSDISCTGQGITETTNEKAVSQFIELMNEVLK